MMPQSPWMTPTLRAEVASYWRDARALCRRAFGLELPELHADGGLIRHYGGEWRLFQGIGGAFWTERRALQEMVAHRARFEKLSDVSTKMFLQAATLTVFGVMVSFFAVGFAQSAAGADEVSGDAWAQLFGSQIFLLATCGVIAQRFGFQRGRDHRAARASRGGQRSLLRALCGLLGAQGAAQRGVAPGV